MAQPTQAELDSILNTDITYRYQMLSRMKADCEYALKAGSMRHLWAENDPEKQIACMRAIWESFPDDAKPEWIGKEEIDQLAVQMGVAVRGVVFPVGEEPRTVYIDLNNSLEQMQMAVQGHIENVNVLRDEGIDLWVNDEGMFTGEPNRALFTTESMAKVGYISQFSQPGAPMDAAKENDLHSVLFGNVVALGFDEANGEIASLTDEQASFSIKQLGDKDSGRNAIDTLNVMRSFGENQTPTRSDVEAIAAVNREFADYAVEDAEGFSTPMSEHPELLEDFEQDLEDNEDFGYDLSSMASDTRDAASHESDSRDMQDLGLGDDAR